MATALTALVTRVGYKIGITPASGTTPSNTEITQWLKDAQRNMLTRLPAEHLGGKVQNRGVALDTTTTANMSTYDGVIKVLSCVYYDDSATAYKDCTVLKRHEYNYLKLIGDGLRSWITSYNKITDKMDVYPAGEITNDKLYLSFIEDLNTAETDYELPEETEEMAVDFACFMSALQSDDAMQMAQKFLMVYEMGIKTFGGK